MKTNYTLELYNFIKTCNQCKLTTEEMKSAFYSTELADPSHVQEFVKSIYILFAAKIIMNILEECMR